MSATRSGGVPGDADAGSWATESLPMSLRKELLERELSKLGFRKAAAQGGASSHDNASSQQQGDSGSSHPQADGDPSAGHGA
jgi:hypothetical protein